MAESSRVRVIPHPEAAGRVETGAVRFDDDWPGLFVRGDNAINLAFALESAVRVLSQLPLDAESLARLKGVSPDQIEPALEDLHGVAAIIRQDLIVSR